TDKSVMEVEAPGTGIIRGLARITGDPVTVGTPVAWIDSAAEAGTQPALDAPAESLAAAPSTPPSTAPGHVVATTSTSPDAPSEEPSDVGIRATPLARRMARLHDVDLAAVSGSGPRGRIEERDIEAHVAARGDGKTAATPSANGAELPNALDARREDDGRLVPFTSVRRIAAQRLTESMRDAPHFYLTAQVEMTATLDALKAPGAGGAAATGDKPSVTVLLARLVGQVLVNHPLVNASLEGDAIRLHDRVHIGIAMDRDGDLIVPVLRDVQSRSLAALTKEYRRLIDAVRSRRIAPSDMRGGTFTISNLGMYGVDAFTAIINAPQSAILAIGRTVATPVGRDGEIVLRPMATLSLSSDHRVVDGITAARFMAGLRQAIENPAALLRDDAP
ncbi:MAG: dihydrolipoamide acetyltransferase family protein, partial [Betaproteobacteria bacterium]